MGVQIIMSLIVYCKHYFLNILNQNSEVLDLVYNISVEEEVL